MRVKYFVKGLDNNGNVIYTDYTFNKNDIKALFNIVRRQPKVSAICVGNKTWNL